MGKLVETQIAGPTHRVFDLMSLGRAWEFCIADRFLGDAAAAGVGRGTTLGNCWFGCAS